MIAAFDLADDLADSYIDRCSAAGELPTVSGLAYDLGCSTVDELYAAVAADDTCVLQRSLLRLRVAAEQALVRSAAGLKVYYDLYWQHSVSDPGGQIEVEITRPCDDAEGECGLDYLEI